jgi:hypothetical protein
LTLLRRVLERSLESTPKALRSDTQGVTTL